MQRTYRPLTICRSVVGFCAACFFFLMQDGAIAAANNTLEKIRETGVIVLGYRIGSSPFSFLDATLKPVGYSMDLCARVVDNIRETLQLRDLKVKLVAVTSVTRIPLVANGTVDLECGVTTNTAERHKSASFALTTFVAQTRLLSKKSAGIRSLEDLRGQAVVSTVGTTSIQYLNEVNATRKLGMRILAGKEDVDSFLMVQTDRAVAYAMDDVLLYSLVAKAADPQSFSISDRTLTVEPYGIALPKDDPAFKRLVDGVIVGLFRSGEIYAIYKHWFESPIPPYGRNLRLPMSKALQQVIAKPTDSSDPKDY